MRVAIVGYGRMGKMVEECLGECPDWEIAGIVDPGAGYLPSLEDVAAADVAIDFSYPGDLDDLLSVAVYKGIPLVIGRTGLTAMQEEQIRGAAERIPIICASNFSPGVTVMRRVVREMAEAFGETFDVEIVETHHKMKQDAPSGTARMLLSAVDPSGMRPVVFGRENMAEKRTGEIGVHALRGGTVCGEHSVHFYGDMEDLTISHRADSRQIFAQGALRAARFVVSRKPGLYSMEDVLFSRAM